MVTATADSRNVSAANGGIFVIGGDLPVARMGFGTMRLTGPGVWGEPANRAEAIAVLGARGTSASR